MFRSAESVSLLITAVSALMLTIAVLTAESALRYEPMQAAHELDVSAGIPLSDIPDPVAKLPSMRVETSMGDRIGEVRSVMIRRDGALEAVMVTTRGLFGLGTVTTTVATHDLLYLRDRDSLVSRLTQSEIATQRDKRKRARL